MKKHLEAYAKKNRMTVDELIKWFTPAILFFIAWVVLIFMVSLLWFVDYVMGS